MKITTLKRIDPSLLGERLLREYSYDWDTGPSEDGMRRGITYTVNCKVYGNLENEIINEDGTYSYDYSSKVLNDHYSKSGDIRDPLKYKHELQTMVEELLFMYNIHEFSTELQDKTNNIKDYYASINAKSSYEKDKEPKFSYNWSANSKESEAYTKPDHIFWSSDEIIKSESLDDLNKQLNGAFSKDDYIWYLMGNKVEKTYKIMLGLDDIGDNETVGKFLSRMKLETLKFQTFESALKENIISMEDIKNLILRYKSLSAEEIPTDILEQLFSDDKELISHFYDGKLPIDILRKYNPNFDIAKVDPNELIPSDLDNLLQNVIQSSCILGRYNGPSDIELKKAYYKYLQSFYDNPEALRKIIPVINTSKEYFFRSNAYEFISNIPKEVLNENEVRNLLLETENIEMSQLLKYNFTYDEDSTRKLVEAFSNTKKRSYLIDLNNIIEIAKQNGIENDEILQALRKNEFNMYIKPGEEEKELIEKFNSFKIEGITLDDIRNRMLQQKEFNFLRLLDNTDSDEITKEYRRILSEMEKNKGIVNKDENKKYEDIFKLMCDYSSTKELFSRLNPEIKDITKRLMIENLDQINELQNESIGYSSTFSKVMKIMSESFEISEDDMVNIYMKCLNNGAYKADILKELKKYIPEEQQEGFEERINKENIYPNPKYFWLTDNNLVRISIPRGDDRNSIKSKIQEDGRCFSTRVKTDMVGESKEGKKIVVNNLSKWLFGVPGARGYLTITRAKDYIQLPKNTPEDVENLIEDVLKEKDMDRAE